MTQLYRFTIQNPQQAHCMMATDDSLFMPGENAQCRNHAYYRIPGELGEYLLGGMVCKEHQKYLLRNGSEWVEAFKNAGIPKGQRIEALQGLYRKQSIFSELS